MGRSYNQTGSDQSCDPPHDQSHDQVPKPVSNQSCDKECEHMLIHTYFCRCNLQVEHDWIWINSYKGKCDSVLTKKSIYPKGDLG